jgi:hypothetical protein
LGFDAVADGERAFDVWVKTTAKPNMSGSQEGDRGKSIL